MVEYTKEKGQLIVPTYLSIVYRWGVSTHKMGLSKRFIGKQNTSYAVRFKTKESI